MYYQCAYCREQVCIEIRCPECGLEKDAPRDFLQWLKVHVLSFKMRFDVMGLEIDRGYIKACEVVEAEFKRLKQEHKDDSDRIE